MELGNMIFGHSRGKVEIDRHQGFEAELLRLFDAYNPGKDFENGYGCEFESDTFEVHTYWWGNDEDPKAERPNFLFKPTGYEIRWYKYPLRDAYANRAMTLKEFSVMIDKCIESLGSQVDQEGKG